MPIGWMIFSVVLFLAVMAALKVGVTEAVSVYGAWIGLPVIGFFLLAARWFDKRDKRLSERQPPHHHE
jgi:positive regulator of sigma E activity